MSVINLNPIMLNGAAIQRLNECVFIALPREAWRSCGRCDCPHCKGNEGFWDTLAVSKEVPKLGNDTAWMVHHPEFTRSHLTARAEENKAAKTSLPAEEEYRLFIR